MNRHARIATCYQLVCLTVFMFASASRGAVVWNETINGDLSNDRLNPTQIALSLGTNSLLATSVSGDREYVTMQVSAPMVLSHLNLVSYVGNDLTAFIGVQAGQQFTEPPTGTNVANLLGYSHFGSGPGNVGTDILDDMGQGAGSMGFTPPLASGFYTFWIQQTGASPATYQFDFVVAPEPSSVGIGMIAAIGLLRRNRRPRASC